MKRIVSRTLPSGEIKNVQPYHISMSGLQKALLCRDDEDYGVMVKYLAVCAHRKNVIIVMYVVVSNHCHTVLLAQSYSDACAFASELKRVYAQWFQTKYLEKHLLKGVDVKALLLDSDWYVRNALAYISRNALDNGNQIDKYMWSGFRAMFSQKNKNTTGLRVRSLTRRDQDRIMHTRENLKSVEWRVDSDGEIIPESFCDIDYLEQSFNYDQAFWLKTIGALNSAELQEKLVDGPRRMLTDTEFYRVVADIVNRWFSQEPVSLPIEKKKRVIPYLWRSHKTTINQLARVIGMERNEVAETVMSKRIVTIED